MYKTFHCRKVNGDPDFSIDEWNESYKYCTDNNIPEDEANKILHPSICPCNKQCFDCMVDVGKRRLKTKELLNK